MQLHTTLGPRDREDLGPVLPHEHVLVDLGPPGEAHDREVDADAVVDVMAPHLERARETGVTALVECTPVGVGRRVDVVRAVSEAADLPVAVATGVYSDPYLPDWVREATEADLREWMVSELEDSVGDTGVRAAMVKLAASEGGLADTERTALRAAAGAAAETGAPVGSHTTDGDVVREQLDVMAARGVADQFVWIHAQTEPDASVHREVARRGAYVEYDALGAADYGDDYFLDRVVDLVDAGFADRVLLSHDRGWYDPSKPDGGEQRPYTHLSETFLPRLREAVGDRTARRLTEDNPFEAFAR